LKQRAFLLYEFPTLGGAPIKRQVSQSRALTPSGQPDMTEFAFVLATADDLPKLQLGQVVELT